MKILQKSHSMTNVFYLRQFQSICLSERFLGLSNGMVQLEISDAMRTKRYRWFKPIHRRLTSSVQGKEGFTFVFRNPKPRIAETGSCLTYCSQSEEDHDKFMCDVHVSFIPLFSIHKSLKKFLSSTESHIKNFVANSIWSVIFVLGDRCCNQGNCFKTIEVIKTLVSASRDLPHSFRSYCNGVLYFGIMTRD